jgi:vaccinia related kinase
LEISCIVGELGKVVMPRRTTEPAIGAEIEQPKKRVAANGNRLPDPIREGELLTDITKNQWKLGRSVGVGGFGEIYLGKLVLR